MSQIRRTRTKLGAEYNSVPKQRKSDRTRQAILDAATEFIWSRPFRELTVAELMALAGTSRSAFYQYFKDLHDLMEALLGGLEEEIFDAASPWFGGQGDPLERLRESLDGLVRVCYVRGPILRAVSDASITDQKLERCWAAFLGKFDDAVTAQIEIHQADGFIPPMDARTVAIALNRLDASMLIHAFGRRPRGNPKPVGEALTRIWTSTLYAGTIHVIMDPKGNLEAKK